MGINLGSTAIEGLKLGTTSIEKIYMGSTQAWDGPTPTGGTKYGVVSYYSGYTITCSVDNESLYGCSVTIVDADLLKSYIYDNEYGASYANFLYSSSDNLWVDDASGQTFTTENLESVTGIRAVVDTGEAEASFHIDESWIVDTTSEITSSILLDSAEYENMGNYRDIYKVGGVFVPISAITSFEFGTRNITTPDRFLAGTALTSIDFTYATSLTTIGNNFLHYCPFFNSELVLPNQITEIGEDFLSDCRVFNSPITLPNRLLSIGRNFLYDCRVFNQPISFPSSLIQIVPPFLVSCRVMTSTVDFGTLNSDILAWTTQKDQDYCLACTNRRWACYTTGITISGEFVDSWRDILPDRTSNPFRKLIIAS